MVPNHIRLPTLKTAMASTKAANPMVFVRTIQEGVFFHSPAAAPMTDEATTVVA